MKAYLPLSILLSIILLLLPAQAKAQAEEGINHWHIGGTVGYLGEMLWFNPSVQQELHQAFTCGAVAELSNSRYSAIHGELLYSLRGWNERVYDATKETLLRYHQRLHYIDLPLLASLHIPIGHFQIGMLFGPQIGIRIAEQRISDEGSFTEIDQKRHDYPIKGHFAWGLTAGPTVTFAMGSHKIAFDARAYMGFNNLISTKIGEAYSRASEIAFVIKLSYLFELPRKQ